MATGVESLHVGWRLHLFLRSMRTYIRSEHTRLIRDVVPEILGSVHYFIFVISSRTTRLLRTRISNNVSFSQCALPL